MLSKKNRVNKKTVTKIFKEGKNVFSRHLSFRYIKNNSTDKKISFIVPKTVSKKAMDRNLLKRRGNFILKKYFKNLPLGFLGVFVFSKKSLEVFGGRKNKKHNPIQLLENEISVILNKTETRK